MGRKEERKQKGRKGGGERGYVFWCYGINWDDIKNLREDGKVALKYVLRILEILLAAPGSDARHFRRDPFHRVGRGGIGFLPGAGDIERREGSRRTRLGGDSP
jgi:hypothetical protein